LRPSLSSSAAPSFRLHLDRKYFQSSKVKMSRTGVAYEKTGQPVTPFISRGEAHLALLPNSPERRLQELEFYSALGAALLAVKGQAASETGRAYALALGLWEQLVISPASCGVLFSAT